MPYRIPVQIGKQRFESINRSRLHYVNILHSYQQGDRLKPEDAAKVIELVDASWEGPVPQVDEVRIARAQFGRVCFSVHPESGPGRNLSIIRSIKRCQKCEND